MSENTEERIARLQHELAYIEQWIAYRVWKTAIPGAQYAVRVDGQLVLSGAVGVANLATGEALTTKHLFRIASHTKMLTATAVLQLVEQGRMRLDTGVGEYIDELRGTPLGARTLRELLDHTAGVIRDGEDGDYWQRSRPFPDDEELLAMVRHAGLKSEAGSIFAYSNLGYSLLGLATARAAGRPWDEVIRIGIIDRLGLDDTSPDFPAERSADLATGYSGVHTSRQRQEIPHVITRAIAPAGGATSTAEDVTAFLDAHRMGDDRLLEDHSKRMMQRVSSGDPAAVRSGGGYGLGMIIEEVDGRGVIGHSGGYTGQITWSALDPASGVVVSVLTNSTDGTPDEIGAGIFKLVNAALSAASQPDPSTASGEPARFEGRFANVWKVLDVVRLGGRLVALNPELGDPMGSVDELEVIDDHTLRIARGNGYGSVGEPVHYTFDEDGSVRSVRIGFGLTSWPFDLAGEEFAAPWTRFE